MDSPVASFQLVGQKLRASCIELKSKGTQDKMEPMVSILMGVYRNAGFDCLRESIMSIIRQSYQNWELIIVDDGSNSIELEEVLNELRALDGRIKTIGCEENRGLAHALNIGLARAKGQYIARQDDDDLSDIDRLSRQVAYLEDHLDISIIGSNAVLYDGDGKWGKMDMPSNPTENSFLWNSPFIHPSVVMRRDDLMEVGGYRVARETARCEDYDLFMRMYAAGFKGVNLQEYLYWYQSDRSSSKYRPMIRRIEEASVRARGFKDLRLGFRSFPYIIKPLIIGLIPKSLYGAIQNRRTAEK